MDLRIREIVGATKGSRILHVGCVGELQTTVPDLASPLWLHGHLMREFEEVWGIDLLPSRIDYLRDAGVPNVFAADAEDYSLDAEFDTIVAGDVIEHLPNPGAFLSCSARHLAPGGQIVVTTPYVHGLEYLAYAWFRYPRTCPNPEHACWLCPTTLSMLASLAGLRVQRWRLLRDDRVGTGWGPYDLALRGQRLLNRVLPKRVMGKTILAVLKPALGR